MSRELKSVQIGGEEYEFEQMATKPSLKLLIRISKIVGKPLVTIAGSVLGGDKLLDTELKPGMLAAAAESLFNGMDAEEVIQIIETLTATTVLCDGKKVDFNLHYEGRLEVLFKVLSTALEVQYGNFFGAILAINGVKKKVQPHKA